MVNHLYFWFDDGTTTANGDDDGDDDDDDNGANVTWNADISSSKEEWWADNTWLHVYFKKIMVERTKLILGT